jgi:hypothetical protein
LLYFKLIYQINRLFWLTFARNREYKLLFHIEELHVIMTGVDDRLCDVFTSCPTPLKKSESEPFGLDYIKNQEEAVAGSRLLSFKKYMFGGQKGGEVNV